MFTVRKDICERNQKSWVQSSNWFLAFPGTKLISIKDFWTNFTEVFAYRLFNLSIGANYLYCTLFFIVFSESLANKGDKERRYKKVHTVLKYSSFFCAIALLIESGLLFLLTIGVPYFAKYFPMIAVYFALIIVPLRQLLNCIYDCINLWSKGE